MTNTQNYLESTELEASKRELLAYLLAEEGIDVTPTEMIPQRHETAQLYLSFAQQRIWLLDRLEPGSHYNDHFALHFQGPLNREAFEASLNAIVARHEALRTTLKTVGGEPTQVISPRGELSLQVIDLRETLAGRAHVDREAAIQEAARSEIQQPFDLTQGLFLRTTLFQVADDEAIFLLTAHQIVNDSWSLGVFVQELTAQYNALTTGQSASLPELPIQYADYALWQRDWFQGEISDGQLAYWRERLGDAPTVLDLPTDHPRPSLQSFQGAGQPLVFSPALVESLRALSRQAGVTLFMTLLAAFNTLLYRYTGAQDMLIGSPIANRDRKEIEALIGVFINTLVLRTTLTGEMQFLDLLSHVKESTTQAYAHPDLPFERLVEALQPERNLSYTPLYQVMFDYQNTPMPSFDFDGLEASAYEIDDGMSRFDLTLELFESAEGLHGHIEYSTALFEPDTIARMAGNFMVLLNGIVADPTQSLKTLPILTEAERHRLLVTWNETAVTYPLERSIHQLFEAQAARTPDAIALSFEGEAMTYHVLNSCANQLARHLQKLGVGPQVFVGLCTDRSVEMVVGLLGILKAGGAYLPLDPAYPQERIGFMLEDTGAPVLLTQRRLSNHLPSHNAQVLYLDNGSRKFMNESSANLINLPTNHAENLAYIIYTSGSTGKPKGVQIPHNALTNFLLTMQERPGLTPQDILLAVTTLSFDISTLELFLPLITGAQIALVSREVAVDGIKLIQALSQVGATVMQATPATWRLLVESGWQGDRQLKVLCGGEALPQDLAEQLLARSGSLWNLYGPTEATVWATLDQVASDDGAVSIGRPIANYQLYILDEALAPVPIGVPGELHIGGDGLAVGYLNRPELTAERFVEVPENSALSIALPAAPSPDILPPNGSPVDVSPQRLYKTGDLARYLPDGRVEYLGRLDHQVKIRGFRIELGEIESILNQHPNVAEAVVIAREDRPGDRRLAAYAIARNEPAPSAGELRHLLQDHLPDYMMPSSFMFLDAFPLTPNRKVDRKALPAPEQVGLVIEESFVSARDTLEFKLTQMWEALLGRKPIGIADNFFELGGHSLLAVRLFAEIERTFGQTLALATLFQAPTIGELADILRQEDWSPPWSSLVAIQPGGTKPPFFCVHGGDGNILYYRDLSRRLGTEQPFYGLQARGLLGEIPHTEIGEMAGYYIEEMKSLQPEGPYYLGGYCTGGTIAFEMAQQLHQQGQEVAFLGLFDAYNWSNDDARSTGSDTFFFLQRIEFLWRNFMLLDLAHKIDFISEKWKEARRRMRVWYMQKTNQHGYQFDLGDISDQALRKYVPDVYPSQMTYFKPRKVFARYNDPRLGWDGLAADGVVTKMVPVFPGGMIEEPFVEILAKQLSESLEEARAKYEKVKG